MNQTYAIAKNTFLQSVRQPIYGIMLVAVLGGFAMAPSLTGFTLDDDNKMLRDICLSTLLIQGLFFACFSASSVINTEIDDKTALTTIAKPINRWIFILGKYLGVLAATFLAYYVACIAFFMIMRHGVLQTSAETSDPTVLVAGPGVIIVAVILATLLNYIYGYRFLGALITLAIPLLTLSSLFLLVVDRDWKIQNYAHKQTMDNLPLEAVGKDALRGIVTFEPLPGFAQLEKNRGFLVRNFWQGPITDQEHQYLATLSDNGDWKRDINFLVKDSREFWGIELIKCGALIAVAICLLASIAVAVSTRLGMISTFLICFMILAAGLASDQLIKPHVDAAEQAAERMTWLGGLYRLLPNFQFFWMIDALNESRVIPWDYVMQITAYGLLLTLAALLLGMALFETREVG